MILLNSHVEPAGESKIVRRLVTERPVEYHGWRVEANWLSGAVRGLSRAHRAATGFPEGIGQARDLLFESGFLARLQRPACSRTRRFLHLNRLLFLAPVCQRQQAERIAEAEPSALLSQLPDRGRRATLSHRKCQASEAYRTTRYASDASKGVRSTSCPPAPKTSIQSASSANREETMNFGGLASDSVS